MLEWWNPTIGNEGFGGLLRSRGLYFVGAAGSSGGGAVQIREPGMVSPRRGTVCREIIRPGETMIQYKSYSYSSS